ncbi:single-stranded DNA-binding protein [Desulfotomaculum copahuensis]|uniref:Single-stranded DNA-binding protein n=1 Tax=Desulfotomaculum copahuensis TaxID=1838280 RepID=A0A1B7LD65_9FIRM|nr:single-stranded DNA-binding protein [Desulfotomaculum copahuensis]OAT80868.1 single-stranded DNA-binding protein [Desulfotomaculum copahuensis]
MVNKVILIGRLTQDPELRYTPNGVAVARFTLAVDRPFANQQGEREADFIDIEVWRKLAETCAHYLGKGRLVFVEGYLQIRSYDDKQGIRRKGVRVVADTVRFLDRAKEGQPAAGAQTAGQTAAQTAATGEDNFAHEINYNEDDIPF